jgi:hypothetical protein
MTEKQKSIATAQVKIQTIEADCVVIAEQIRDGGLKGRAAACAVTGIAHQFEFVHNILEGLKND